MTVHALIAALSAALVFGFAAAQDAREGERPPRPDSASNAAIGGWCDALTGAKKEQCLRDERKRQEEKATTGSSTPAVGSSARGTCDALTGPDKERCLRQGGTVEVNGVRSTFPRAAE